MSSDFFRNLQPLFESQMSDKAIDVDIIERIREECDTCKQGCSPLESLIEEFTLSEMDEAVREANEGDTVIEFVNSLTTGLTETDTLKSYVKHAHNDQQRMNSMRDNGEYTQRHPSNSKEQDKFVKREHGINTAVRKIVKQEPKKVSKTLPADYGRGKGRYMGNGFKNTKNKL